MPSHLLVLLTMLLTVVVTSNSTGDRKRIVPAVLALCWLLVVLLPPECRAGLDIDASASAAMRASSTLAQSWPKEAPPST